MNEGKGENCSPVDKDETSLALVQKSFPEVVIHQTVSSGVDSVQRGGSILTPAGNLLQGGGIG